MGNKVAAGTGTIIAAVFAAFVLLMGLPSLADAGRDDRGPGSLAFSIIDMVNQRLCERQDALGGRLGIRLVHPSRCGHQPPPPEEEEPSVTLTADPMTIEEGESTTLEWDSDDADSCEASGGWSGEKSLDGSQSVSPDETTTYTITCEGDGGTDSDSVTVTVEEDEPDAPTVEITADPMDITEGESTTLTWNSDNADSCTASDGWSGDKAVDGSQSVSPTATTTYTIECEGDGGTDSDSVTVNVSEDEPEMGTLIVRKVVIRDDGDMTATTTFSFEVNDDDAESFESDGENSMSVEAGTYDIVETEAGGFTTSYSNCTDVVISEGETETCTITNDDVDDADEPTVSITASRMTVFEGSDSEATTTLEWESTDADECTASNGWSGDKDVDGEQTVTPTATTTYAITCTGDGGTAQDSVTVDFVPEEDEEPTPSGNLLITEVMYDLENDDSQGVEPGNEWIELHNGTDGTLDLTGYSIIDTFGASSTIPDGTMLEAGAFLILTASSTTEGFYDIPDSAVIIVVGTQLGNGLGNAGDSVLLRNDEGNAVDEVSWGTDTNAFSPAAPDAPAGQTIGRVDIDVDTGSAADWETKETPSPGQE